MRLQGLAITSVLDLPVNAQGIEAFNPPASTAAPFGLLLLSIAVLPLFAEKFWHRNRNKALVAALLATPIIAYLLMVGEAGTHALMHALAEYASFIVLLGSLYTVAGGIALTGDLRARPIINVAFLALGAVLANFIGTTGASMLLIRPVLQTNSERKYTQHLPVFFIFIVSNLGGLLTPLGDPPLFLGFLNGVDFFWTLSLWRPWLVAIGVVLSIFFVWDTIAYRREPAEAIRRDIAETTPLRIRGLINLLFLAGIVAAVLLQSDQIGTALGHPGWKLEPPWGELMMLVMAAFSLLATPRGVRQANGFGWSAIAEVAVLFAGIFVTMAPVLVWLQGHGATLGVTEPWQYFWLSGGLSSFLDNAPTYLTFATLAAGSGSIGELTDTRPLILAAISCGSVFMGANTYIGNGPNFMVKAIADEAGYKMPSFFGYMLHSALILLPTFGLVTWLFF